MFLLFLYKVKVFDDFMGEELRGGLKVDFMGLLGLWLLYRRGLGGGEVVGRGGFRGGLGRVNNSKIVLNFFYFIIIYFINCVLFIFLIYFF